MRKIVVAGAIVTQTMLRLRDAAPEDTDIIVMDEFPEYPPYRGGRPKFIYIDEYPELMEPKSSERDDKPRKRKDFWNELPKPKRGRR